MQNRIRNELKQTIVLEDPKKKKGESQYIPANQTSPLKTDNLFFTDIYQVEQILGEGAHAIVKRCVRIDDPTQQFAMKEYKIMDDEVIKEVKKTFFVQQLLAHNNIAKTYQLFIDNFKGRVIQVMEYLPMQNLPLGIQQVKDIMLGLLNALQYMHERAVVHRDIKLDNILIDNQGDWITQVKVVDFSISKRFMKKSQTKWMKRSLFTEGGSIYYMAPEIFINSEGYDQKIDVWAAGIILYQLLTDRLPFHQHTVQDTIIDITNLELSYQPLHVFGQDLKDLMFGMLNKNPELRFTAEQALLNNWLNKQASPLANSYQKISTKFQDDFPKLVKSELVCKQQIETSNEQVNIHHLLDLLGCIRVIQDETLIK